jgi:hypothetical protein
MTSNKGSCLCSSEKKSLWFLFSVCVLLVYRKATDFCILILYPATLPKEFMIHSSFLVELSGSLSYRIMSPANRDSLTSSKPIESFLFLALALMLWLKIPKLY